MFSLDYLVVVANVVWGWQFLAAFTTVALILTFALGGVQFRYFLKSWRLLLSPSEGAGDAVMSPFQAFINSLGNGIGNGSIAGVATAIASGGPGAVFWMLVFGFLYMAIRYAEVYLSIGIEHGDTPRTDLGGPMRYLGLVPGGTFLPYIFSFLCLSYALSTGNAMQCNSMTQGIVSTWGISPYVVAGVLLLFILYLFAGGAKRIVQVSDAIVPFKVGAFLISALIVLATNVASIVPALKTIFYSAFDPVAAAGGVIGLTVMQGLRYGVVRSLNASEAGLGTAAVFYGSSKSSQPVQDSIMSMLSVFIGIHIIAFMIGLLIVMSGMWNSGLTSTPLAIAAFAPTFGSLAGWIITFVASSFGIGVIVSYAFLGRQCFLFLTRGKFEYVFMGLYLLFAFIGCTSSVDVIWSITDLTNAAMVAINLYGIMYLLPIIRRALVDYARTQ